MGSPFIKTFIDQHRTALLCSQVLLDECTVHERLARKGKVGNGGGYIGCLSDIRIQDCVGKAVSDHQLRCMISH